MMQLEISRNSEIEENNKNENNGINDFTVWKDVMHRKQSRLKTNFSMESKICWM